MRKFATISFLVALLSITAATQTTAQLSFALDSTFIVPPCCADGFMTSLDLNKDGIPDLFVTRGATLNRGDGHFTDVVPVGDLNVSRQSAVTDVDGDGFVDLVVPDFADQSISFVMNHSGFLARGESLSLAGLVSTPVFATAVSAGDVNGDGFVDLGVVSRQTKGPLIVLTNNGAGRFAPLQIITNGFFGPSWIHLADINADGRVDILCGDLARSMVVFTNSAGRDFVRSCVVSNVFGVTPNRMRVIADVADVNGDGLPDLLCPSLLTNNDSLVNVLSVVTNAGNGVFLPSSATVVGAPITTDTRGVVVIAKDFNSDGKVDCVFQSEPDDRFVVVTNRGDGTFSIGRTMATSPNRLGIAAADFNGDGMVDIASGDSAGFIQVYLNTSSPLPPRLQIAPLGSESSAVFWRGGPGQFDLQFSTDAASPTWQTVVNGEPVTGVIVSNGVPARFFRLNVR